MATQYNNHDDMEHLKVAVDKANEKLDIIDLALRGDNNGRIGIVEQVRQLYVWKQKVEEEIEKRDEDARQIRTALIGAIAIGFLGAIGTAAIAGAKHLGWFGHVELGSK